MRYENKFDFKYRILSLKRAWCATNSNKTRTELDNKIQRLCNIRKKIQQRLHKINEKKHQEFMKKCGMLSFHRELAEYQMYNIRKSQIV